MTEKCQNCGNNVSDSYARVLGDNNGNVEMCIKCSSQSERTESGYD